MFSACTKTAYIETREKLARTAEPICGKMTPIALGKTVVIGNDSNVTLNALNMEGNTYITLPVPSRVLNYSKLWVITDERVKNAVKCIENYRKAWKGNDTVIQHNNSKVKVNNG